MNQYSYGMKVRLKDTTEVRTVKNFDVIAGRGLLTVDQPFTGHQFPVVFADACEEVLDSTVVN